MWVSYSGIIKNMKPSHREILTGRVCVCVFTKIIQILVCLHACVTRRRCVCICAFHSSRLHYCASNSLHNCNHHITAVFPHTLWLAPLSAFGNVCLQSLASLHLEHAPGKLPDLCAIRLVVISSASAPLSPMRMLQLSALCCWEARAVMSALVSPTITAVSFPVAHRLLLEETVTVFSLSFRGVCMS